MREYKVQVSEKAFEEALERHEKNWQKELEEVDIRAVVLKTKKAVLEQAMINSRCENAITDQMYEIKDLKRHVASIEGENSTLKMELRVMKETLLAVSKIVEEMAVADKEKKKGLFSKIGSFFRCLVR